MSLRTVRVAGVAGWIVFLSVGTAVGLSVSDTEVGGGVGFLAGLVAYMSVLLVVIVRVQRLADNQDTWRSVPLRSRRR